MCTSNTLMKIDTRVYSPSSSASGPRSSGGGGTLVIIVIKPSAGATMNLSPRGVVRTGSRKKAATQIVAPTQSQPRAWLTATYTISVTNAAPTAYLRPSGWIDGKRHLTFVVGSGLSCLSSAGIGASLVLPRRGHNAAVACPPPAS